MNLVAQIQAVDGWVTSQPAAGERNLTRLSVVGGTVFATTFIPSLDLCSASGTGSLYALYYMSGTGYNNAPLGTQTIGSTAVAVREVSFGRAHASGGKPVMEQPKTQGSRPVLLEHDLDRRAGTHLWRFALRLTSRYAAMRSNHPALIRFSHVQKESERERRTAVADVPFDEVAEAVESGLERERVRRCLGSLTELQRESVTLAYYGGYTYGQVASLLGVPGGTIKTRMRDALIRLRDCLGVAS